MIVVRQNLMGCTAMGRQVRNSLWNVLCMRGLRHGAVGALHWRNGPRGVAARCRSLPRLRRATANSSGIIIAAPWPVGLLLGLRIPIRSSSCNMWRMIDRHDWSNGSVTWLRQPIQLSYCKHIAPLREESFRKGGEKWYPRRGSQQELLDRSGDM